MRISVNLQDATPINGWREATGDYAIITMGDGGPGRIGLHLDGPVEATTFLAAITAAIGHAYPELHLDELAFT